jgi:hypothetical protein
MHREVKDFVKEVKRKYPSYFREKDVLEVGSKYINGSVRKYFRKCRYLGLDLDEGRGVDLVCHAKDHVMPRFYDVVISTEAMEHDKYWRESLRQMYDNLASGGLMIVTCASVNRLEHGTNNRQPECSPSTLDYYRNISSRMFQEVLPMSGFKNFLLEQRRNDEDLMFYGIKA